MDFIERRLATSTSADQGGARQQVEVEENGVFFSEYFSNAFQLNVEYFQNSPQIFMVQREDWEFVQQLLIQEIPIIFHRFVDRPPQVSIRRRVEQRRCSFYRRAAHQR